MVVKIKKFLYYTRQMNSKTANSGDIYKSAIRFITGEEPLICRLCVNPIQSDIEAVSIEDSVTLERHYYNAVVSFEDIFQELGATQEQLLPKTICMDCALKAIDSFLFQKFCEHSNSQWQKIIDNLEQFTPHPELLQSATKSLFITTNETNNTWIACFKPLRKKNRKCAAMQLKNANRDCKNKTKICKVCNQSFNNIQALKKHRVKTHMIIEGKQSCSDGFKVLHKSICMSRLHTDKKIPCLTCDKRFVNNTLLLQHIKLHHTPVNCSSCEIQLPSKYVLLKHIELHPVMQCPMCQKIFSSKIGFKDHILLTCGEDKSVTFYCDICNKGFLRKNSVRNHLKVVHGFGKVYSCEYCDKKYAAISSLKQHVVKHTKEKKFSCEQCGGLFVTLAALTYHTRIHTGEKPYPCNICGERFLSASRRVAHKYTKHLGPNKQCSMCPSRFITNHQLKKHVERHYNPQSKLFLLQPNVVS